MSDRYDEMAAEIHGEHKHDGDCSGFVDAIAAALRQAARVPPGHVREGDVDWKIEASWGYKSSVMTFQVTRAAAEAAREADERGGE